MVWIHVQFFKLLMLMRGIAALKIHQSVKNLFEQILPPEKLWVYCVVM
jgi:hypothetical protein